MFEITEGKLKKAQKVVLYGPEGIGKSTFASGFPSPIFIDTEGSTSNLDVKRLPKPKSWAELLLMVKYIKDEPGDYKTLVIDTADWAEILAIRHVCSSKGVSGIEDFGYGKGYTYLAEEFGKFLNSLTEVTEKGINVLVLAHAMMRKFEEPDEMGAYDRWELKLQKKTAPLVKEWADAVLFANYKTIIITDSKTQSKKPTGGKRIVYTSHHPAWDAKNRWGLPEEISLDPKLIWDYLLIEEKKETKKETKEVKEEVKEESKEVTFDKITFFVNPFSKEAIVINHGITVDRNDLINFSEVSKEEFEKVLEETGKDPIEVGFEEEKTEEEPKKEEDPLASVPHEGLKNLMEASKVSIEELENVVIKNGFFPAGTKIENFPDDFIEQMLLGHWEKVIANINK